MPKRTRPSADSGSDVSEFEEESEDSSFEVPKSTGRVKETRQTRKLASKRTRIAATEHEGAPSTTISVPHPASWHVVSRVDPIRESLLQWYDKIHDVRGMPWRKPYDASLDKDGKAQRAYEVWVSEIMLQQTQVVTVIPYYNRWMTKFPTVRDLAASDIETVNGLWKGLGYYSRAARLLSGAQIVVKELGGRLPDNANDMQAKIPGIGRYSAGAICSIAYNECAPVLDGNVIRLLTRFLALYAPPKGKQAQDILWAGAEAFVEGSSRPGDINQALIELGSTVCKVRDPACSDCALRPWCRAYQRTQSNASSIEEPDIEELCNLCEPLAAEDPDTGLVTIFPMKVERKKAREELDSVNVIEWHTTDKRKRLFILVRRPEGGLLAGLHEFPTIPNISGASATAPKVAEIPNRLLKDLLIDPPSYSTSKGTKQQARDSSGDTTEGATRIVHVKPAGDVVHVFSHIKKTYRVQWVLLEGGGDEPPKLRNEPSSSTVQTDGKTKTPRKGKRRARQDASEVEKATHGIPVYAQWIPLDDVKDANIGTGVMKVWKQVQTLW